MKTFLKYFGGKAKLSKWIVSLYPNDYKSLTYLEPCVAGGACLLEKEISRYEIISDINPNLIAIWNEIKHNCIFFQSKLREFPYSQNTFDLAKRKILHPAINEFILLRMSRSALKKDFAWSDRLRGGMPENINSWNNAIDRLSEISLRLHNVFIYNMNIFDILEINNNSQVFTYIDPPYMLDTRVTKNVYDYEMSANEHYILSEQLNKFDGKVLLSGYNSQEYEQWYKDWNRVDKEIVNHSGQNKKKNLRIESLWMNY